LFIVFVAQKNIIFVARKNIIPAHEAVQSSCNITDEWEQ